MQNLCEQGQIKSHFQAGEITFASSKRCTTRMKEGRFMPPGMLYPANARQREFIISPLKYIPAGFQWRGVTPIEHVREKPTEI